MLGTLYFSFYIKALGQTSKACPREAGVMYVRRIGEAGNLAITGLLNVLLHQRPLLILRVINNSSTGVDPKVSVFCFPAWVESSILSSTSYYT